MNIPLSPSASFAAPPIQGTSRSENEPLSDPLPEGEAEESAKGTPFEAFLNPFSAPQSKTPSHSRTSQNLSGELDTEETAPPEVELEDETILLPQSRKAIGHLAGEMDKPAPLPGRPNPAPLAQPAAKEQAIAAEPNQIQASTATEGKDSTGKHSDSLKSTGTSESRIETSTPSRDTALGPEKGSPESPRLTTPRSQSKVAAIPAEQTAPVGQERLQSLVRESENFSLTPSKNTQNPSKSRQIQLTAEPSPRTGIPPANESNDTINRSQIQGPGKAMEQTLEQSNRPANFANHASGSLLADSSSGASVGNRTPQSTSPAIDAPTLPPAISPLSSTSSSPALDPGAKLAAPPAMQQSIDHIQSLIKDQALVLKRFDQDSLTAEIRPDGKTSITLSLQRHADGITVNAQLDPQNAEWLKTHWSTLQSKLAEQNITLELPKERTNNDTSLSHERQTEQEQEQKQTRDEPASQSGLSTRTEGASGASQQSTESDPVDHSSEKVYWA